jgi:hypothetical protein
MRRRLLYGLALVVFLAALPLLAQGEKINYEDINKIKAEGMQRSQVMELNSWLSDVYAPRVTGSPTYEKAAKWALGKMTEWGLVNVKMEPWTDRRGFERGWTNDKFYLQAVSPERFPIPGTPTAWTPGTNGLVSGEVVLLTATAAEELAPFKGKLKGKWVITQAAPDVPAMWDPQARRYTPEQLAASSLGNARPRLRQRHPRSQLGSERRPLLPRRFSRPRQVGVEARAAQASGTSSFGQRACWGRSPRRHAGTGCTRSAAAAPAIPPRLCLPSRLLLSSTAASRACWPRTSP